MDAAVELDAGEIRGFLEASLQFGNGFPCVMRVHRSVTVQVVGELFQQVDCLLVAGASASAESNPPGKWGARPNATLKSKIVMVSLPGGLATLGYPETSSLGMIVPTNQARDGLKPQGRTKSIATTSATMGLKAVGSNSCSTPASHPKPTPCLRHHLRHPVARERDPTARATFLQTPVSSLTFCNRCTRPSSRCTVFLLAGLWRRPDRRVPGISAS